MEFEKEKKALSEDQQWWWSNEDSLAWFTDRYLSMRLFDLTVQSSKESSTVYSSLPSI